MMSIASTVRRHRAHPPAAGAVDARPGRGVRRRRRAGRTPQDLHQHGQARDCDVRVLRAAFCRFLLSPGYLTCFEGCSGLTVWDLPCRRTSTTGNTSSRCPRRRIPFRAGRTSSLCNGWLKRLGWEGLYICNLANRWRLDSESVWRPKATGGVQRWLIDRKLVRSGGS
jgi:hypothetical protein